MSSATLPPPPDAATPLALRLVHRHLVAGFGALFVFAAGGLGLEILHALKAPAFVDAGAEATRLLLRLAHAHGTLLGLLQIAHAAALGLRPDAARADASFGLLVATVLLPGGFALGAIGAASGDPGPLVALAPVGAAGALFGIGRTFAALVAPRRD